jgi:hypothetical protein
VSQSNQGYTSSSADNRPGRRRHGGTRTQLARPGRTGTGQGRRKGRPEPVRLEQQQHHAVIEQLRLEHTEQPKRPPLNRGLRWVRRWLALRSSPRRQRAGRPCEPVQRGLHELPGWQREQHPAGQLAEPAGIGLLVGTRFR